MKINFNEVLKDLDDKKMSQPKYDDDNNQIGKEDITIGMICKIALSADEKDLTEDKKFGRFMLAMDIQKSMKNNEPLELTDANDASLLKKVVNRIYPPLIVGRVFQIIDGSHTTKKEK